MKFETDCKYLLGIVGTLFSPLKQKQFNNSDPVEYNKLD